MHQSNDRPCAAAGAANNFVFGSVGTMTFGGACARACAQGASSLRRINFIVFHELRQGDDSAVVVERVGLSFTPVSYSHVHASRENISFADR